MAEVMIRRRKFSIFWNGLPEYTYTGQSEQIDEGPGPDGKHNWQIKFLTNGTLTFKRCGKEIDVFLVGGGGGGSNFDWGGGGGGGYTKTFAKTPVLSGKGYPIVIGEGGAPGKPGKKSTAFGHEVLGGKPGGDGSGGAGGSGGGRTDKDGGSDGVTKNTTGKAQGTTTRPFGDPTLEPPYSGGGAGGSGQGTKGGYFGGGDQEQPGLPNSGGGGAGNCFNPKGSAGGSGIIIIRNLRK